MNKIYLDLERIDNRELFSEKNYDAIIHHLEQRGLRQDQKMFLALDELQLAPQVVSVLKYFYDHYDIKCIVSGSSSFYLKNLFSESLSGRKKIFELYPLDFGEFLTFKKIHWISENFFKKQFSSAEYERLKSYYQEYLDHGGFPEVVLAETESDKKDLLSDIVSSYINIDVRTLADFRDQEHFYALMKMLAQRVGTRLDHSKLAKLIGVSRLTIGKYLTFLEKTYFINRIPVLAHNPDREIVKAKKLYLCDNGILKILADVSSGTKFENAVFHQLRQFGQLAYYSLKTGKEIDFIVNGVGAFEVKESPTGNDRKNLTFLASRIGLKQYRLIGKHLVPGFTDYIWGGDIR